MSTVWEVGAPGVVEFPSGRLIRGRALRAGPPPEPHPGFGLYLLRRPTVDVPWDSQWIRWPDFWLPTDRADAAAALTRAWVRAAQERVEVACAGGLGRTGTALACIGVIDGLSAGDAVAYVRDHYDSRAIETPWQRRFVRQFSHALRSRRRPRNDEGRPRNKPGRPS